MQFSIINKLRVFSRLSALEDEKEQLLHRIGFLEQYFVDKQAQDRDNMNHPPAVTLSDEGEGEPWITR